MSPTEKSYTPPAGATIYQLVIKPVFETLELREKFYAHYLARAAFYGSRIIMRQVSQESLDIFDFIMSVYGACEGHWDTSKSQCKITSEELGSFLEYAAMSSAIWIMNPLIAVPPFSLGFPNKNTRSGYYPGSELISQEEVDKQLDDGNPTYLLLQASAETEATNSPRELAEDILLVAGDHNKELTKVCIELAKTKEYAANDKQAQFLADYIETFRTGSLGASQEWQKAWVTDEAMVGIADPDETAKLKQFVESSTDFIRKLPWAVENLNDGKGPFEKNLFEAPDFTNVYALAVCGSIVFEAANLPNYEYIWERYGFKNIVLSNRLSVNNNPNLPCHWVDQSELKEFKRTTHLVRFLTTAIHELVGHRTGILLSETTPGTYNFDKQDPPINPLNGKAVTSHYLPGQTWTSVFGKLAGTIEECRAILVSEYLMDDTQLLSIFGYHDTSEVTAGDLLYAFYLNIGVDSLQALECYNFKEHAWGQAHHRVYTYTG
ncbi:peptidase family M49-domain-containing protein [Lophiotrema nucula]|uniref:Peptidase family M49-domain-containing protein n=1 Tax=Lophiotrema nucula TaxID=690887 RepID=A0A6A5ZE24_9PLEO|nr:peptidase family M49-domain-containing protein [Lophiotrema nucula]